ncbi:hypothetical protein J0S82_017668 [Galemys pyrenaicus]|uniref:Uncharacterized protein n=1 Tax=Galemys pyrenaicus TaxID=202257 RepID=A0A8J6DZC9_GALPY|nr:hypothetical protein J0S82_017668 [Galemys pyrenaicus]
MLENILSLVPRSQPRSFCPRCNGRKLAGGVSKASCNPCGGYSEVYTVHCLIVEKYIALHTDAALICDGEHSSQEHSGSRHHGWGEELLTLKMLGQLPVDLPSSKPLLPGATTHPSNSEASSPNKREPKTIKMEPYLVKEYLGSGDLNQLLKNCPKAMASLNNYSSENDNEMETA